MGITHVEVTETQPVPEKEKVVNDLSIQVATVNGSGSQTANTVLLRAIFQMGVPVSGKNLFPSNIAGLPTWFTIRASKHGYIARRKEIDFLVAMNPETAEEDVQGLRPGSAVVYDERLNLKRLRNDVVFYPVPFDQLVAPVCPDAKLRRLVRNMIYDGVLARLLGIEMEEIRKALQKQFKKKLKAVDLNFNAARAGYEFAEKNLPKADRFTVEGMDATRGKSLIDGNSAADLGALFAGVTGLPTRTMQGDVLSLAFLSHGDTQHILLFPNSVKECFSMGIEAFDLAEEFQTPVFVMSDLDLGMNNWMADPFPYPERPIARGKVLTAEDVERLGRFERYHDVDGDGIPYRTLPGTNHPKAAYFVRGSGHDETALYTERPDDYVKNMDRLNRKFATASRRVPGPVIQQAEHPDFGIIAYGSSHWAVVESLDQLKQEYGLGASYCRLRAFPFSEQVKDFCRRQRRVYVIDQNRDGQMLSLLRLAVDADDVKKLDSVRHYSGLPIDARTITDAIAAKEVRH